jgi:hypothetical protein
MKFIYSGEYYYLILDEDGEYYYTASTSNGSTPTIKFHKSLSVLPELLGKNSYFIKIINLVEKRARFSTFARRL